MTQAAYQRQTYDRHYATRTQLVTDQLSHPLFREFYDRLARLVLDGAPDRTRLRVIEFACGEGLLAAALHREAAKRGITLVYTGSDLSTSAIELAKMALPDGRWIVGDAAEVARQRPAGSAELVLAKNLLHHLTDPAGFLTAAAPLLAPEGRVTIAEASRGSPQAWVFNLLAPIRERYFFASRPQRNIRAFQAAGLRLRAVDDFSWLPYELAFAIRFGTMRRLFDTDDPRWLRRVSTLDETLTKVLPLLSSYLVWSADRPSPPPEPRSSS